jgi:hypothetical protein
MEEGGQSMTGDIAAENLLAFAEDDILKQIKEAKSIFNMFEAIGATNKELWHSDFLTFLLNPKQNHGLGDEFMKRLLKHTVPELSEIESWEDVSVRREYRYIDILIQDEEKEVSVIIENKIWSPEAPGQLAWYWETITGEHKENPDWHTYGIFLTRKGQPAADPNDRKHYPALSYSAIKDILSDVLEKKSGQIRADVEMTIQHYIDMLGRFIVGNIDAEALAREMYFKHRSAIQLMNPTLWKGWIKSHLDHLIIEASEQLQPQASNLEYVRFRVRAWDAAEGLKAGTNSATSHPMLFFDFYNYEDSLTLYLWIGPTISAEVYTKLLGLVEQNTPPFCKPVKEPRGQYRYGYQLKFLTKSDYETCSDADLKALIETKWRQFRDDDLPLIRQAFESADWFMKAPSQLTES